MFILNESIINFIHNNDLKLTEFPVVCGVEEEHHAGAELNEGSEAAVLGLEVLVVPPPVGAAAGAPPVDGVLGLAGEPTGQLTQLDLGQRGVRCKEKSFHETRGHAGLALGAWTFRVLSC